ncbi:MAG: bifunctional adenosylcobinamide kinase/adenosylcobinamide-phosphate guanylyltransferase [Lachnospiraceae bacterium]|nr:bifunctional adenosylcobinamide kinase/adenosylcobinamide-phosphate guanylyltransferase [Lachnospiraceae bacterium]
MLALITGGSGSGKSEYAENLAVGLAGKEGLPLYYLATMKPFGEEGRKRVERHQKLRTGKKFLTIERYVNLKAQKLPDRGVVLLECLSNLTANEMFEADGAGSCTPKEVLLGIEAIRSRSRHLVVVTNDIFSDGVLYDETTRQYQRYLGELNQKLAKEADEVTEVVCGIPVCLKRWRDDEKVVEQL